MKMKLASMAVIIACLIGCVSVENTKAKLESGDKRQRESAEEWIRYKTLGGSGGMVQMSERMSYAKLIDNSELACKILAEMIENNRGDGTSSIDSDKYAEIYELLVSKVADLDQDTSWKLVLRMNEPLWEQSEHSRHSRGVVFSPKSLAITQKYVESVIDKQMNKKLLLDKYIEAEYSSSRVLSKWTIEKLWSRIVNLGFTADEICVIKDIRVKSKACSSITNEDELKKLLEKMTEEKSLSYDKASTMAELIGRLSMSKDKAAFIARIGHLCFDGKGEFIDKILDQLDQNGIVVVAVKASDEVVRGCALRRIRDVNVIAKMFAKDLPKESGDKISLVRNVGSGSATRELYESTKDEIVRKEIMIKLPDDVRVQIRQEGKAACEKLIQESQAKASETFALKGFYLGMDIGDADRLLGYYFNDWSTREGVDDGVRVLWVPQQTSPLCRAGKDGKVYELNFGKRILKLWFKYDVQDYREWAAQYSRENNVNLAYKFSQHETTVYEPDMSRSYEVVGYQDTFQHKNNTKEYRVTYFGEKKDFTFHGGIGGALIKEQAAQQLRFILGDPGLLRVKVDRD